ncbi:hypothetical protein [Estrella lausannensis]|uniref:Uncharacterized protein n=1 Tax=Estrella lausannensis TaxID=483423 RepID=A0A0H5DP89_9BACT|nr:hypothetical protein [Estrella lausannensis]CRX38331.1 hypothetical protein ELAC_0985 [Estrella lausannensis]
MAFDYTGALTAWRNPVAQDATIPVPQYPGEDMDREAKHDKVSETIVKFAPCLFSRNYQTRAGYTSLVEGRAVEVTGKEVVATGALLEQVSCISNIILARLLDAKEKKAPLTEKQTLEITTCFKELSDFWKAQAESEQATKQISDSVEVLANNIPYVLKICDAFVQYLDVFGHQLTEALTTLEVEPSVKEAVVSLSAMFFDEALLSGKIVNESMSVGKVDFTRVKFDDAVLATKKALLGIFAKAAKEGRAADEQEIVLARELIVTWKDRMIALAKANELQVNFASGTKELEMLEAAMKQQEALFKRRVEDDTADLQTKDKQLKEYKARTALSLQSDEDLKSAIEAGVESRQLAVNTAATKLEATKGEQSTTLGELLEDIRLRKESLAALKKEMSEFTYNNFYYSVSLVPEFTVQPATLEQMTLIADNLAQLSPLFDQYARFGLGKAEREPKASGFWSLMGY